MTEFEPIHTVLSSSRYDRTPLSLWWAFRSYVLQRNAEVVALTEVGRDARFSVLKTWPTWNAAQDPRTGRDDTALCVLRRRHDLQRVTANQLTFDTRPSTGPSTIYATVATDFFRPVQERLVWSTIHFPAHVEGARGLRDNADGAAYLECLKTLRSLIPLWEKNIGPVIVPADWNLDWSKPWVRDFLREQLPMLDFSFPPLGTHTNRIIDGFGFSKKASPANGMRVLVHRHAHNIQDDGSSDHKPVKIIFKVPKGV